MLLMLINKAISNNIQFRGEFQMKKIISILTTMFLLCLILSISAFASTSALKLDSTSSLDNIFKNSQSYKDLIKKDPGAKLMSRNEMYYKMEINDDNTITKTSYTPTEYALTTNNTIQSSNITPLNITKSFGWINVSTYAYKETSGKYFVSFTYNWITVPYWQLTDAIVIGADSNLLLSTTSVYAYHNVSFTDNSQNNYVFNWNNPDMQCRGANTYGINVSLMPKSYNGPRVTNAYGGISAEGILTNQVGAKYFGGYGHRQITVGSPTFSYSPGAPGFCFSFQPSYDEANLSDTVLK